MTAHFLFMAKRLGPGQRLRQWLSHRGTEQALPYNRHKPRLTPENARRDHQHMLAYLGLHALVGALIGSLAASAIILLDIGGLGSLISRAPHPIVPALLVIVPFASLFSGAAAASAILTLPYDAKFQSEDNENDASDR